MTFPILRWIFTCWITVVFALLNPMIAGAESQHSPELSIHAPSFVIEGVAYQLLFRHSNGALPDSSVRLLVYYDVAPPDTIAIDLEGGQASYTFNWHKGVVRSISQADHTVLQPVSIRSIPGWMSLLPPIVAIVMALIIREIIASLCVGLFLGAVIVQGYGTPANWLSALFRVGDTYLLETLTDKEHMAVIIFSFTIGGMVAIISHNGGMAGILHLLGSYARSRRSTQLLTYFMGLAIFFDDFTNTLIVGNTMRPITDRYRISREKLAYIVDSTAAPVTCIAFFTTWLGVQLGYIKQASANLGIGESAYTLFISSLQYSFYPVLTLFFMFWLLYTQRDFGPMLKAEQRARNTGLLNRSQPEAGHSHEERLLEATTPAQQHRWYNAIVPVAVTITATVAGLFYTGFEAATEQMALQADSNLTLIWQELHQLDLGQSTSEISLVKKIGILLSNADAYQALLWASLLGAVSAIALSAAQKLLTMSQMVNSFMTGINAMMPAMLVLMLAWALSDVARDLKTADYLITLLSGRVSPQVFPFFTFLISVAVVFGTGSSWGAMAIIYPLALPACYAICQEAGLSPEESMQVFYHTISVVLAGAVMGDHCSPLADTTILSSLASGCNHIEHVRTQLPYSVSVGVISLFLCIVPVNFQVPWYLNYLLGALLVVTLINMLGKKHVLTAPERNIKM